MLDDLAVVSEPKDVDPGRIAITRPVLPAMQHDKISVGDDVPELDALAGIIASRLLEIVDEPLLAVGHAGIVLDVFGPDEAIDGLPRAALIEHQVVEGDDVLLVMFR